MKTRSILTSLFILIVGIAEAQRPMPLEYIESKLDSINGEANKIYQILKLQTTVFNQLKENPLDTNHCSYFEADSLLKLIMRVNGDQYYRYMLKKEGNESILKVDSTSNPNDDELKQLNLKSSLLSKVSIESDLNEFFNLNTVILNSTAGSRLYLIPTSNKSRVFPTDTTHLYYFNLENELKDHQLISYQKRWIELPPNIYQLSLVYKDQTPFIQSVHIALFRLYQSYMISDKLDVLSRRNRRLFEYNATNNSLKIKK